MKCPICNARIPQNATTCPGCHTRIVQDSAQPPETPAPQLEKGNIFLTFLKYVVLFGAFCFCFLLFVGFAPSVSSVAWLISAILCLPVPPVRKFLRKILPNKKLRIGVTVVLVLIAIFTVPSSESEENIETVSESTKSEETVAPETDTSESISEETPSLETETELASETEPTPQTPEEIRTEYIQSCESIPYTDIQRNPDKYTGKHIMIQGEVTDMVKAWFGNRVTLDVENEEGTWYVVYEQSEGEDRVLKGDYLTVYGDCTGIESYKDYPGIHMEYYELIERPPESETEPESESEAETKSYEEIRTDYIQTCETVSYTDIERNPDNYKGKNVKVQGEVIQVYEGWFNSVTLRIESEEGIWYVTYKRSENESRILENDIITAYGECTGVETYKALLGNSITIPSMTMEYYELSEDSTLSSSITDATVVDTPSSIETLEPEDNLTIGQKNAIKKARSYLDFSAFSRQGLIDQLEFNQFDTADAEFAVDYIGADWKEQAVKKAKSYLDFSAFSYSGLIGQLTFNGFTEEEATYGADNCEANWMEQAAKKAKSYLEFSSFSRDGLIDQLIFNGFTEEQAIYGVTQNGY